LPDLELPRLRAVARAPGGRELRAEHGVLVGERKLLAGHVRDGEGTERLQQRRLERSVCARAPHLERAAASAGELPRPGRGPGLAGEQGEHRQRQSENRSPLDQLPPREVARLVLVDQVVLELARVAAKLLDLLVRVAHRPSISRLKKRDYGLDPHRLSYELQARTTRVRARPSVSVGYVRADRRRATGLPTGRQGRERAAPR